MIKSIYKLVKPSDSMTIYIGSAENLIKRENQHKLNPLNCLKNWIDNSVKLEFIELREANTRVEFEDIEYEFINMHRSQGYKVLNYKDGRSKKEGYTKSINDKYNAKNSIKNNTKNKESGQKKIWNDKHNSKKHPDYNNWISKISHSAKKEGLTSKQYKEKYNISEYIGPKKK